ncbi:MAG TPA: hypothetical protein VFR58_07945 [Flavisolibacter sp.]|nr:hypothetical protein [Flavisolibacter sp.]
MENWENKILADKLNGIEGLPAGYQPNLEAKWDILQSGLPKEKAGVNRYLLAALLLLLLGSGALLWTLTGTGPETGSLATRPSSPGLIKQTADPVLSIDPAPVTVSRIEKKSMKAKALKPAKPKDSVNNALPVLLTTVPNQIDSIVTPPGFTETAVPLTVASKKNKKKVFQRDFSGITAAPDTEQTKTASQEFSIRFKLPSLKRQYSGELPAFRIKQNL